MSDPLGTFVGSAVCAGLCCLDMQLLGATRSASGGVEAINSFERVAYSAGGSVPNTAGTLAALLRGGGGVAVTAVARVGRDAHADELRSQLRASGVDASGLIDDPPLASTSSAEGGAADAAPGAAAAAVPPTSLAVLPVFNAASGGGRACWVNLAANDALSADEARVLERGGCARVPACV
jgi:hypothetical protein